MGAIEIKTIKRMLKSSLENDSFQEFALALNGYHIFYRGPNEPCEPNITYNIEAIYDYYIRYPESGIDKQYYDALFTAIQKYTGYGLRSRVLESIRIHSIKYRQQIAPFYLDCQSILDELRGFLYQNKEHYLEQKDEFGNTLWYGVEFYDKYLRENFNLKG